MGLNQIFIDSERLNSFLSEMNIEEIRDYLSKYEIIHWIDIDNEIINKILQC